MEQLAYRERDQGEISLWDIAMAFKRQRRVFLLTCAVFFGIAILMFFLMPENHQFTRQISLAGSYSGSNQVNEHTLFSNDAIVSRLNSSILPLVVSQATKQKTRKLAVEKLKAVPVFYQFKNNGLDSKAKIYTDASTVALSAVAGLSRTQAVNQLFNETLAKLNASEKILIEQQKVQYQYELKQTEAKSQAYKQFLASLNKGWQGQLPKTGKIMQPELVAYGALSRHDANQTGLALVNHLLLMQQSSQFALQLRNTLFGLDNTIKNLKQSLATLVPARFYSDLIISPKPVGLGRAQFFALMLFLGIFIACCMVGFFELSKNLKQ